MIFISHLSALYKVISLSILMLSPTSYAFFVRTRISESHFMTDKTLMEHLSLQGVTGWWLQGLSKASHPISNPFLLFLFFRSLDLSMLFLLVMYVSLLSKCPIGHNYLLSLQLIKKQNLYFLPLHFQTFSAVEFLNNFCCFYVLRNKTCRIWI